MYRFLFACGLSRLDPERAHHLAIAAIRVLPMLGIGGILRFFTRPARGLGVTTMGLHFDSPFGVAAGFDKEGVAIRGLGQLGFGHVEVGTVTARAQPGNPRPRLFRLIPDRGIINRMGFNNAGAVAVAGRLAQVTARRARPVIGINIGKSRIVDVAEATADYLVSTRLLTASADYLVVNVSSPNTPGLRGLQEVELLAPLLASVRDAAGDTPVLVKIAPDLTDDLVVTIAGLAVGLGLSGVIATNTTTSRAHLRTSSATVAAAGEGGLSGPPLAARSLEVLALLRSAVPADFCIISVGGVETGADVAERLHHGATLVQGYTAFVYLGPLWARQINRQLAQILPTR